MSWELKDAAEKKPLIRLLGAILVFVNPQILSGYSKPVRVIYNPNEEVQRRYCMESMKLMFSE